MKQTSLLILAALLFLECSAFRHTLERDPVTHVLVLLPALAAAGWLAATALTAHGWKLAEAHANSVTLISVFTIAFWMLPRYIDASLTDPMVEAAKFVSLPLLVGAALAVAWPSTHPILRGFLKANAISMLGVMAFLYTHAPIRICNSYLVQDQEQLGYAFLCLAIALSVAWAIPLFLTTTRPAEVSSQLSTGEAA